MEGWRAGGVGADYGPGLAARAAVYLEYGGV